MEEWSSLRDYGDTLLDNRVGDRKVIQLTITAMDNQSYKNMSRSRFLRTAAIVTAGVLLAPNKIFAQTSPVIGMKNAAAKSIIQVQSLRGDIHVLTGAGGNIAVFSGADGKLMVDCGIDVASKNISRAVASINSKPLKYLVNTHWHFDHTGGNELFHNEGAIIIAHANTRKHLSTAVTIKDFNYTFQPVAKSALPTNIFQEAEVVNFNGAKIQLRKYAPAHTDSDISVYFPEADVLHVGDTWGNGSYPFIDHSSGGILDGMINASNHNLDITTNKTIIIPGHGPVGDRSQLLAFRDMLVSVQANVSKLKKEGRTLQETIAAKPTAAYDEKWGKLIVDGPTFTMLVYADV